MYQYPKLLEIEKEIVSEVTQVDRGDKHRPRKSGDHKAEISKAFVQLSGLICALRSADFLRWCYHLEQPNTHSLFLFLLGLVLIYFISRRGI